MRFMATRKSASRRGTAQDIDIGGNLWLARKGHHFLESRRIKLLEDIARHGSITRAAKASKLSYKGAWDMIEAMNNLAGNALVTRTAGGAYGGGTQLTLQGQHVVQLFREIEGGHRRVIARLAREIGDPRRLADTLRALTLRTSARNQFAGRVTALRRGRVNADVVLDLGDDLTLTANITLTSLHELGLRKHSTALALVKANFVTLVPLPAPRASTCNVLTGTIAGIRTGAVNSEVKLSLAADRTLVAVVDRERLRTLGLRRGMPCCALISAAHVLIAVND